MSLNPYLEPSEHRTDLERQLRREHLMRQHGLERHLKRARLLRDQRLASKTGSGRDLLTNNLGLYVEAVQNAFFRPTNRPTGVAKSLRATGVKPERIAAAAFQTILDGIFQEPSLIALSREVGRAVLIEALAHQLEVRDLDAWSAVKEQFNTLRGRGYFDEIVELLLDAIDHFDPGSPVGWDERKQAEIGTALVELAIASTPLFEQFQPEPRDF